jgi:hypothetical protein
MFCLWLFDVKDNVAHLSVIFATEKVRVPPRQVMLILLMRAV